MIPPVLSQDDLERIRADLGLEVVCDAPDARTSLEWAKLLGVSQSTFLRRVADSSNWKRVTVIRPRRNGVKCRVTAYRFIGNKEED